MSKIKSQISYFDLTGGINNVDTIEKINSSPKKTETPDMLNVEYYKLGGIKSMEGNTQIGSKQDADIVGGWEYTKGNSRYMMIALKTGELKVYDVIHEEGEEDYYDFIEVYKFPNNSDRVSFCNMNNGVVATNGVDDPVFYEHGRKKAIDGSVAITSGGAVTGTATNFNRDLKTGAKVEIDGVDYRVTAIASNTSLTVELWSGTGTITAASNKVLYLKEISLCHATLTNSESEPGAEVNTPIRGRAIQYYNGRLWIGTDNGLFYSAVGLYDNWDIHSDAGVIYSVYNDTSEVQALGLYSDYMLVHKRFNTYLLTCTGEATTIDIKPYSNVTCNSQQSWVVSNTKYFVYSRDHHDIFPLSQRTIYSDRYLGEAITNKVRNIFESLNDNETRNIFCATYPKNRWMLFYIPLVGGAGSNYALIYDFQTKSFLARQLPINQNVTIAFNFNSNVYVGTKDGRVLKEFAGNKFGVITDDETSGENITAYYKTPWFDWAGGYMHSFSEFMISLSPELNNNFKIRTFKDGGSEYEERVINTNEMIGNGLKWDGGIEETEYKYIIKSFPNEDNVNGYDLIIEIPKLDPEATEDTTYAIDEDVYVTAYKDEADLILKTRATFNGEETVYTTLTDYFADGSDKYLEDHLPDNTTTWDNDIWTSGVFTSIRMLLPNNVFEQFQLEIYIDGEDNQAFAVDGFAFRRLRTDEAPW